MTTPSKAQARMVPADQPEVRATGGIVDPSTPRAGTEGTEYLVPLASALMPLHDAPDIENVPAASSMHALMEAIVEIFHGVRAIQDHLGIPRVDDDDEEFCSRCYAGIDSDEHHTKCVVTEWAHDGESADDDAPTWDAHPAARPAAPTVPATPPVGAGSSEGANGAQAGAGELGEAIRGLGTHASVPSDYADALADRADALERTLDGALEIAKAYREDHLAVERVRALADDWESRDRRGGYTPLTPAWAANALRAALEAAAPLIAGRALRQAADDWQTGEWANVPRKADRVADRLGAAQHVCDWLRAEAGRVEKGAGR